MIMLLNSSASLAAQISYKFLRISGMLINSLCLYALYGWWNCASVPGSTWDWMDWNLKMYAINR